MQSSLRLALAGVLVLLTGCALLGFGPPTGIIEGNVFFAEAGTPVPRAEVCVFGRDTVCVRADEQGQYRVRLTAQTLLLRFRTGQLPPAASDSVRVLLGGRVQVDCGISERLVISDRPVPCRTPAGR